MKYQLSGLRVALFLLIWFYSIAFELIPALAEETTSPNTVSANKTVNDPPFNLTVESSSQDHNFEDALTDFLEGMADDKLSAAVDPNNAELAFSDIEPLYTRALNEIVAGRNDMNPTWSPTSELVAFERGAGDQKEILIVSPDGSIVRRLYLQSETSDSDMQAFLADLVQEVSFNSGLTWAPDAERYVFMSNGGGGNYDLYLGSLKNDTTERLTQHTAKEGLAQWSPQGENIVFVSGRTGKGDLYLMNMANRQAKRLTPGGKAYLYPEWSPDGKKIVMIYGSNENHDIYLINDVNQPVESMEALTTWEYDDLRPKWSPDGRKIAFYSNYNSDNDPKIWSIIVIAADGTDAQEGHGLVAKVVAYDVIPDIARGPEWMPDSQRIVYVKNDRRSYNPIYVVNLAQGTNRYLRTTTKMNHDIACSHNGMIAFRAQVEQWDHIHITELRN